MWSLKPNPMLSGYRIEIFYINIFFCKGKVKILSKKFLSE